MNRRLQVTVLGATGSIGCHTLDVIARHPERFRVHALTAHRSALKLLEQCRVHRPDVAVLGVAEQADWLRQALRQEGLATQVEVGQEALCQVASDSCVDSVMAAIVGAAGLLPALAAARSGKRVLLANKEALVMSGGLFMEAVKSSSATLLPIDSEHNAIFQCLPERFGADALDGGVSRLLLTASGGPFRGWSRQALMAATPEQACAHPNWSMGRKISVDSATLMNKGLELIEACWLFNVAPSAIEVIVHPQSTVHSMVAYRDGSVLAQLGNPDMRTPIAYGLGWPERIEAGVAPLNLLDVARLDFEAPDEENFRCLPLARQAIAAGKTAPAMLNAANEVAVAAFLEGRIGFTRIADLVSAVLDHCPVTLDDSVDAVLAADRQARDAAWHWLDNRT